MLLKKTGVRQYHVQYNRLWLLVSTVEITFFRWAHFWLDCYVNRQNYRCCSEKLYFFVVKPHYPQKGTVSVVCVLMASVFFCPDNEFWTVSRIFEDEDISWCLQRTLNSRYMSYSRDLSLLDFFLWGCVKEKVYRNRPNKTRSAEYTDNMYDNVDSNGPTETSYSEFRAETTFRCVLIWPTFENFIYVFPLFSCVNPEICNKKVFLLKVTECFLFLYPMEQPVYIYYFKTCYMCFRNVSLLSVIYSIQILNKKRKYLIWTFKQLQEINFAQQCLDVNGTFRLLYNLWVRE